MLAYSCSRGYTQLVVLQTARPQTRVAFASHTHTHTHTHTLVPHTHTCAQTQVLAASRIHARTDVCAVSDLAAALGGCDVADRVPERLVVRGGHQPDLTTAVRRRSCPHGGGEPATLWRVSTCTCEDRRI